MDAEQGRQVQKLLPGFGGPEESLQRTPVVSKALFLTWPCQGKSAIQGAARDLIDEVPGVNISTAAIQGEEQLREALAFYRKPENHVYLLVDFEQQPDPQWISTINQLHELRTDVRVIVFSREAEWGQGSSLQRALNKFDTVITVRKAFHSENVFFAAKSKLKSLLEADLPEELQNWSALLAPPASARSQSGNYFAEFEQPDSTEFTPPKNALLALWPCRQDDSAVERAARSIIGDVPAVQLSFAKIRDQHQLNETLALVRQRGNALYLLIDSGHDPEIERSADLAKLYELRPDTRVIVFTRDQEWRDHDSALHQALGPFKTVVTAEKPHDTHFSFRHARTRLKAMLHADSDSDPDGWRKGLETCLR